MEHSLTAGARRLDMIDAAKGIGMLFVVFAHVNYTPELLVLIYSFHMPLFFLISGMLFRRDRYPDLGTFLRRRFRTLIAPYLVFSVASICYVWGSERLFPALFDVSRAEYLEYFRQILVANWSGPVLNTPLWFVPCLFAVELGYFFLSRLKTPAIIAMTFLLASLGWVLESGLLAFDNKTLPWALDSALYAMSFYACGNLAMPAVRAAADRIRDSRREKLILLGILAVCVALWLPLTLANGKISLGSKVLGNGFLLFLTGVIGSCGILAVAMMARNSRFLSFCGQNSFCIMATHYMFRKFTLPKFYALLDLPKYHSKVFAETIIPFLAVLAMTLTFTAIYAALQKRLRRK